MSLTFIFIFCLLVVAMFTPFISLYAVSLIKEKEYQRHIKIQKRLFWVCVIGVVIFEVQLRMAGGSGSLVAQSKYVDTSFFRYILTAHIIGAVLTYLIWAFTIFWSDTKFRKKRTLPGFSSQMHRKLAYISITGLFYTAITSLIVWILTFYM